MAIVPHCPSYSAPLLTDERQAQAQPPLPNSQAEISVKTIEVTGSTVFSKAEFQPAIEFLQGKKVTRQQLQAAAAAITKLYLEAGYITSRAVLVEASLATETIEIPVIEGSLETIEVEGTERLNPDYVRSRVALGTGTPLNANALEEQLRLLKVNPRFEEVQASLRAGTEEGKSILAVRVIEADAFFASTGFDNYSPPSIGAVRAVIDLGSRNLSGIGDEIVASYRPRVEAFTGTYRVELSYQAPLNPLDGKLQLSTLIEENEVVQQPFDVFEIQGESQRYSVSYRQPLVRTLAEELALSLSFTYYHGQNFTIQGPTVFGIGPDEQGNTRTSAIQFGQEYTRRDAGGVLAFRSQLRLGVCVLDATCNSSPIPSGDFFAWLAQVQRLQILTEDNLFIAQADWQLTPDSLFPSEQFVIGGGESVRGYRQNLRSGDNGFRVSLEDRITVARDGEGRAVFTVAPFFDMGYVWNASSNPNPQPPQRFLAGLGLGLIWQPIEKLNLRIDYAPPLIDVGVSGNNVQDDGFYFTVNYQY